MLNVHEANMGGRIAELIITDQEFGNLTEGDNHQIVITRNDLPVPPRVSSERITLHNRNKAVVIVGVEEIGIGKYKITLQDAGPEKK